jgi:glycosyltransferase involved in cell wall biosynthesis
VRDFYPAPRIGPMGGTVGYDGKGTWGQHEPRARSDRAPGSPQGDDMPRPTVSVIIPVHKARIISGMLNRALTSVQAQTLLPDAIHIAIDNDHEGAAATRQQALMCAKTDFVAFLDSDDVFLPRHLEWLIGHQQKTNADFVYSWFKVLQQFADGSTRVLEEDPVFPVSHYMNEFDPENPIETTITTLVRTGLAQEVGFHELDRGQMNTGEDYNFVLGCVAREAKIRHLRRKSWLWCHHRTHDDKMGNTSGRPGVGDDVS